MQSLFKQINPCFFCSKGLNTLLATNISAPKGTFEDDFPFSEVGYVSSLEGRCSTVSIQSIQKASILLKWNVAVGVGTDDGFAGPYVTMKQSV